MKFDLNSSEVQSHSTGNDELSEQLSLKKLEGEGNNYIANQTMLLFPSKNKSSLNYPRNLIHFLFETTIFVSFFQKF